jgi:hypothetical protein
MAMDSIREHAKRLLMLRKRWSVLIPAAGALAGLAAAIALAAGGGGSGSGSASGVTATGGAVVQRRHLVAIDTEAGTLGYTKPRTLYNRLSGTVTWLPAAGQIIEPGKALSRVNGKPIVLIDGQAPAWRDLGPGIHGPDVRELNRNLVALGYDPDHAIAIDAAWQAATTDAVNRFQRAMGRAQSGSIPLGQVVFLPGPQRVTSIQTSARKTWTFRSKAAKSTSQLAVCAVGSLHPR